MNLQCRHCQTVHDDAHIRYVAQIPLCVECAADPPLHVIARRRLANSYDPAVVREVCDMVEELEQDYGILKRMSESKPIYSTRPVVRLDDDGTPWLWLHGSRYRRLHPDEVSGSMGNVLAEGDTWLRDAKPENGDGIGNHAALQPVRVDDWDPVAVVCRVARGWR
jgi:hypothetical protein